MRADITCPLGTMTSVTAVTERRKQNQHSRRPAHKTRFGADYDEEKGSEYLTPWSRAFLGSLLFLS
jgi:hypothetical protein